MQSVYMVYGLHRHQWLCEMSKRVAVSLVHLCRMRGVFVRSVLMWYKFGGFRESWFWCAKKRMIVNVYVCVCLWFDAIYMLRRYANVRERDNEIVKLLIFMVY